RARLAGRGGTPRERRTNRPARARRHRAAARVPRRDGGSAGTDRPPARSGTLRLRLAVVAGAPRARRPGEEPAAAHRRLSAAVVPGGVVSVGGGAGGRAA